MTTFRFLLYFLATLILNATLYEDAEDKKTSRWKLVNPQSSSSINNIYDANQKSRVIEFQGEGTRQAYALKSKKSKKTEYWLSWQMQFSEDFVIIVVLKTNVGKRYLIYTPGVFKGDRQYGLGDASINGKWQTFRRNLQEDIAYFDNRVNVVSLQSFVVKGNGRVDNIMTQKTMLTEKKVLRVTTSSLPIIRLKGKKLVKLRLGETYVEEGVEAYDREDGEIDVVSMENIDSDEVGRYMILYMATDSHGNMALDKRYVHIGEVQEEIENNVNVNDNEAELLDDDDLDKNNLLEQEEQIRIWENELALREKELVQREKKSNKN